MKVEKYHRAGWWGSVETEQRDRNDKAAKDVGKRCQRQERNKSKEDRMRKGKKGRKKKKIHCETECERDQLRSPFS